MSAVDLKVKLEVIPVTIKANFCGPSAKVPLWVTVMVYTAPAVGASMLILSTLSTLLSPDLVAFAVALFCSLQG